MGKKSRRRKKDRIRKTKMVPSMRLNNANNRGIWHDIARKAKEEEVEENEDKGINGPQ